MASNIGIKIANGEFYPLVEENSYVKKRLVLTTVHDNQPSAQIDLYRSSASVMSDAQYIGSLVVENIQPKPKGDPSIEMVISSNADGEIVADAVDLDMGEKGEHNILTVSLKSLDETARDLEIPDFDLDAGDQASSGFYEKAKEIQDNEKKKFPWSLIIILLILLALAALFWFFNSGKAGSGSNAVNSSAGASAGSASSAPAAPQPDAPAAPAAEPVRPADPPPVIAAPAEPPPPDAFAENRARPSAPVSAFNVPAVIPREGVNYTIRWGDTLWDISEAFYRTPWQYPRIAEFNNIRNPDLIISGRTIKVPPRN